MSRYIPTIVDKNALDVFSTLLEKGRIIFITDKIDDLLASNVCAQLLLLEHLNASKDIHIYINSPGGSVTAALAIYDIIQMVKCDVATYCLGQAASAGALLLLSGRRGKRFMLPSSRTLIHQPLNYGGITGQETDIRTASREITRLREYLEEIISKHTGQPMEVVRRDTERDFVQTAEESVTYGIADRILLPRAAGAESEAISEA